MTDKQTTTALLGAFGEEVKLIEDSLENAEVVELHGHRFVTGTIGTQRVVVTLTGIGKTNAALTTGLVMAHFRPDRVIFTGIAGGVNPDLQPGDLVIGGEVGYHDVRSVTLTMEPTRQTMHPVTYALNPLYFPADPTLLMLALQAAQALDFDQIAGSQRPPTVHVGRILTGDDFIHSAARATALRDEYGADAIEMEGAAVAQVCHQMGIPCLVIRKLWRLFYKIAPNGENQDAPNEWIVTDEAPTADELKVLHKTIKKAQEDIENYSFNTSVSAFMVCVNELAALKCHKRAILQDLVLLLSPYAPHIAEELWAALGNEPGTVSKATYPVFNPQYLVEASFEYPIQINGKVRTTINFPLDQSSESIEQEVLANEVVIKWLEGKAPKKVVVVQKRIVNVVP